MDIFGQKHAHLMFVDYVQKVILIVVLKIYFHFHWQTAF
jgi:hypothetical protein